MTNSNSLAFWLQKPNARAKVERELATRYFREFVHQAWPIIEPSTPFVPGWHIDAIIDHLEAVTRGEIRNLLINVPPRHMKSLLTSVLWPAWEWIQHPERRWLFSSYAASLNIRDSIKCRTLIESPWYQSFWGDRFALSSDQNTKTRFDNNRSGTVSPRRWAGRRRERAETALCATTRITCRKPNPMPFAKVPRTGLTS